MTISSELILFYSACSGVGSLQPITNEVLHHKAANMVIDRRYYINCDVYLSTHGKHSTSPATAAQYLLRKRDNNSANHDSQDCYRPTTAVISKCTISRPILRHKKKKKNRIALTIFVYELLLNKLNTGISISYTYSTSLLFFLFRQLRHQMPPETLLRVLHKRIYLHSTQRGQITTNSIRHHVINGCQSLVIQLPTDRPATEFLALVQYEEYC